jgi:hypothetical protein
MDSLVHDKITACAKGFSTLKAFIGLLSSVGSHMYPQARGITKGLPALFALIGFLSCVRSFVYNKVRACAE